jgi:hypothetical protein
MGVVFDHSKHIRMDGVTVTAEKGETMIIAPTANVMEK